jgi:hypothetical protein
VCQILDLDLSELRVCSFGTRYVDVREIARVEDEQQHTTAVGAVVNAASKS